MRFCLKLLILHSRKPYAYERKDLQTTMSGADFNEEQEEDVEDELHDIDFDTVNVSRIPQSILAIVHSLFAGLQPRQPIHIH